MLKTIIRVCVLVIVFFTTILLGMKFMNKGHDNITMEMSEATFPLVSMSVGETEYNLLHGYDQRQSVCYARENITMLGENRNCGFTVYTYGEKITGMELELRSIDGERLIEHSNITGYKEGAGTLLGEIELKDLLDPETEYSLEIQLNRFDKDPIYYYTYVVWSDSYHLDEKMAFVLDFHNKSLDKEVSRELTRYLETDSSKESNTSFYQVNIHSSYKQITYGDLEVVQEGTSLLTLKDIDKDTASFTIEFELISGNGSDKIYYQVEEYFRIRYTTDRIYLLDYERQMEQRPNLDQMCSNDKLALGITDENVTMKESEDGNTVAFVIANQLLCYNVSSNKLARVFSFYDDENDDLRTRYKAQEIRILDIDEGGNVSFAVYGYMNRGRHEGEVGIEVYYYDGSLNTIEELLYIPYSKSYRLLIAELDRFIYMNREQHLYISIDDYVYCINLRERTAQVENSIIQDTVFQASDSNRVLVTYDDAGGETQAGEFLSSSLEKSIILHNLYTESKITIEAGEGKFIRILGFMGDDLIYGIGDRELVGQSQTGGMIYPMNRICICDENGKMEKEYSASGFYVTNIEIEGNQIVMERVKIAEDGTFLEANPDQITTTFETLVGKNVVAATDIDIYERYIQIKVRSNINEKTLKKVTPKEVVYEGGRSLLLEEKQELERFYVYSVRGVEGIEKNVADAVTLAENKAGRVLDSSGNTLWKKTTRVQRNQIMAISENTITEEKNSLVVCLDTILKYEGIIRNSEYLLRNGQTIMGILSSNLEEATILDLTGCSLSSVLYYVNKDIPVMAVLGDGEAVLITGFNEYNVVIMDPVSGTLYKKGMNDSERWFEENGNVFLTYMMPEDK